MAMTLFFRRTNPYDEILNRKFAKRVKIDQSPRILNEEVSFLTWKMLKFQEFHEFYEQNEIQSMFLSESSHQYAFWTMMS